VQDRRIDQHRPASSMANESREWLRSPICSQDHMKKTDNRHSPPLSSGAADEPGQQRRQQRCADDAADDNAGDGSSAQAAAAAAAGRRRLRACRASEGRVDVGKLQAGMQSLLAAFRLINAVVV